MTDKPKTYQKIAPRLYVRTFTNGTKSWVYRYTIKTLTTERGLGSYAEEGKQKSRVALSEVAAKKQATIYDGLLAQGIDPFGRKARKQMTFGEIIHEIIEVGKTKKNPWAKEADGTCKTEDDYLRLIEKDAPRLAKMRFDHPGIEDEVEAALKPVWGVNLKKGEDMRARIYKAFERAKLVRKVFQGENPASRERIVAMLGEGRDSRSKAKGGDVEHRKALPWEEVPGVFNALRGHTGMAAMASRFMILTTARTANVRFCNKKAIDREARTWTVSAKGHTGERMKSGVEHTYYLSDEAMEIVNALWDQPGDYLFPGANSRPTLASGAIREKLCHPKKRGGLALKGFADAHGFRSTFANWVSRHHAEKKAIADAMLAHADGKVQAAYWREMPVETMQFLSTAWGRHCAGANVVPFKKKEEQAAA
jgi:integrase